MSQTTYRDTGGRDAVEAVVDDCYERVLADEQLAPYFDGMDGDELRSYQVQFISAVAGGPVEYSGANVCESHAHLGVEEVDFDLVGRYLQEALAVDGVPDEHVAAIMSEAVAPKDPVLNR
jgi:hemoglobin